MNDNLSTSNLYKDPRHYEKCCEEFVDDIASIKKEIRKKNASILNTSLTLAPRYFIRAKSIGFALSLRF